MVAEFMNAAEETSKHHAQVALHSGRIAMSLTDSVNVHYEAIRQDLEDIITRLSRGNKVFASPSDWSDKASKSADDALTSAKALQGTQNPHAEELIGIATEAETATLSWGTTIANDPVKAIPASVFTALAVAVDGMGEAIAFVRQQAESIEEEGRAFVVRSQAASQAYIADIG